MPTPIPVGFFFSTSTRIERFGDLLGKATRFGLADFSRTQRDVAAPRLLPFRDTMLRLFATATETPDTRALKGALESWDGAYAENSSGALAFEVLLLHFGHALLGPRMALYTRSWDTRGLLAADLAALDEAKARMIVAQAAPPAARALAKFRTWGEMHRLRLPHALARLPLLGRRLAFGDYPVGGNSETILKSGGGFTDKRHFAGLVAVSRHVSDMGDLDANYFVLLGGQDGWLGSTTLLDQVPLWRDGTYVQVPLRPETVRAKFTHQTILSP
jgi:penicillin amidase